MSTVEPGHRAHDVNRRARLGIRLLMVRQVLVQLLMFGSGVVLARTLPPADFGSFGIALFVVTLAGRLTELGLQPALIQRAGELEERELRTAFTIQQGAALLITALVWCGAGALPGLYPGTSPGLVWMVRLLSLELSLATWRGLSEVLLERALRYDRLAPIDVTGSVAYAVVGIGASLHGQGAWSFVWAFLASSVLRTALVFQAAPWPIRPRLDRRAARRLLRAGIPVQITLTVTHAQYWVTPTLVAGMVGPEAVGFLQWASGNGRKPLEFLDNVARVSLPHFSILQSDVAEVERLLTRYVHVFVLVCGLWLAMLAVAGRDLVALVYTARWDPAVPALALFAAVGLLVAVRVIVGTALVGLGRMVYTARASSVGALVTIGASVALVMVLGPLGVPLGQLAGAAVTLPLMVHGLGDRSSARILGPAARGLCPIAAAAGVGLGVQATTLSPPLRGLVAWWTGPAWMRTTTWRELALAPRAAAPASSSPR